MSLAASLVARYLCLPPRASSSRQLPHAVSRHRLLGITSDYGDGTVVGVSPSKLNSASIRQNAVTYLFLIRSTVEQPLACMQTTIPQLA